MAVSCQWGDMVDAPRGEPQGRGGLPAPSRPAPQVHRRVGLPALWSQVALGSKYALPLPALSVASELATLS